MNKLLTPIVLIIAIFAGSAGANFLKSPASDPASEEAHDDAHGDTGKDDHGKDDHGAKKDSHDDHDKSDKKASAKKDDKKSKGGGYGDSGVSYFKFSREFVIPLMRGEQVESLIIMNLNLEVDSGFSGSLFSQEPKLRDNIMSTLIALSNDGVTLDNFSRVESYETIRSMVLQNLNSELGPGILNVLILDMAKQEV